jgi:hypothetical protein
VPDARAVPVFAAEGAEAAGGRASEVRDGFFCSVGFERDGIEGFLDSCPAEEGGRIWDWLPEGLSTGNREAGLGIPEARPGREDGGSAPDIADDQPTVWPAAECRCAVSGVCRRAAHIQPGEGPEGCILYLCRGAERNVHGCSPCGKQGPEAVPRPPGASPGRPLLGAMRVYALGRRVSDASARLGLDGRSSSPSGPARRPPFPSPRARRSPQSPSQTSPLPAP